jgi:hypothetical protein
MGRVSLTSEGALLEVRGPRISGTAVPDGYKGRTIRGSSEAVRLLLNAPEAERYDEWEPETWGRVPTWCQPCREWRWLDLDELREAFRTGTRTLLG